MAIETLNGAEIAELRDKVMRSVPELVELVKEVLELEVDAKTAKLTFGHLGRNFFLCFDLTETFRKAPLGLLGKDWIENINLAFSVRVDDSDESWCYVKLVYDHRDGSNGYAFSRVFCNFSRKTGTWKLSFKG